ncbi:MAG TPA: phosphoribosyltransferase, partial [Coxiellaceae bacterium]|nr:phosphoribosyltransferase [Coxiellaceae bacterium]
MNTSEIIFRDRKEAGQKLAELLKSYTAEKPIILAMPRGGVVVAYEIAQALKAPLDVIVSRKIGAPSQPEYAIGAIAPGDIRVFNDEAISSLDISKTEIE